ncbi:hypothetical protein GMORB2_5101 [Geosmithia morbida]|uniref:Tse2 ADP-ribosyltransferase toxin domain-containing protein n=1 Tax=Geosmithia morbida TaxID=1094350 RepID=A0A9P4YYL8_9HYPO|nr:uncharacterized protein GMORB2_5101 [Geosmithia morbida]KAF4124435.1 hypothetical protein GMORB2_5101 [Geosmithia morbida]
MSGIKTYQRFPRDLFRINSGWRINLRPLLPPPASPSSPSSSSSYDITPEAGPNGATLRPNTPYTQHYVNRGFRGPEPVVYAVGEGTVVPDHLILVHEGVDREELELNNSITEFLIGNAALISREQWSRAYPRATEPKGPNFPLARGWRVGGSRPLSTMRS